MAIWQDFVSMSERFGAEQVGNEVYLFTFDTDDARQQVYLMRETMQPDMDFVRISCPLNQLVNTNAYSLIETFGGLTVGSIHYIRTGSTPEQAIVALGATYPVLVTDLSEPTSFLLVMNILARAARRVARQIGGFA